MKNGSHQLRKRGRHGGGNIAGQVMLGVMAIGAVFVFMRTLPDLIRYMRLRRM